VVHVEAVATDCESVEKIRQLLSRIRISSLIGYSVFV
jgi:hypothetical protein